MSRKIYARVDDGSVLMSVGFPHCSHCYEEDCEHYIELPRLVEPEPSEVDRLTEELQQAKEELKKMSREYAKLQKKLGG